MTVFISHNSADKTTARLIGSRLVELGVSVWFDEWKLRPGDSITGGIGDGIRRCDTFVLVWSRQARRSKWVNSELSAMIVRRVANAKLKIVPVMLDDTPLPTLVADYKGFALGKLTDLDTIAREVAGVRDTVKQGLVMRRRYLELVAEEFPPGDSIRSLCCPNCASQRLLPDIFHDLIGGDLIYEFCCGECSQRHGTVVRRGTRKLPKLMAPVAFPPYGIGLSAHNLRQEPPSPLSK